MVIVIQEWPPAKQAGRGSRSMSNAARTGTWLQGLFFHVPKTILLKQMAPRFFFPSELSFFTFCPSPDFVRSISQGPCISRTPQPPPNHPPTTPQPPPNHPPTTPQPPPNHPPTTPQSIPSFPHPQKTEPVTPSASRVIRALARSLQISCTVPEFEASTVPIQALACCFVLFGW